MGSSASKEPERERQTLRPTAGKAGTPLQRINSNVALYRGSDNSIETTPANTFYEHVFLVTMGRTTGGDLPETCVLVSQSSKRKEKNSQGLLTDNSLGEAVYERLMIQNPSVKLVRSSPGGTWYTPVGAARDYPADEACSLKYMYHCFVRWKTVKRDAKFSSMDKELEKSKEVILQQTQMCLQQPELFAKQNVYHQLVGICIDAGDALLDKASAYPRVHYGAGSRTGGRKAVSPSASVQS
ncbi:hypothetical protein DPMN_035135 [Dreissena polymorpha]|uniref:Uncharacterized protein n=1 Tax=Dreissena polymorpha TaxID=45954 RepID=A0A9D4RMP2_DREPO|nr:hypothetical protein DPMN_035135 [Dreissena polymorpha]